MGKPDPDWVYLWLHPWICRWTVSAAVRSRGFMPVWRFTSRADTMKRITSPVDSGEAAAFCQFDMQMFDTGN